MTTIRGYPTSVQHQEATDQHVMIFDFNKVKVVRVDSTPTKARTQRNIVIPLYQHLDQAVCVEDIFIS